MNDSQVKRLMSFVSAASLSSSRYSSSTAAEAYLDRYPNFMMKKMHTTIGGIIPRTKPVTLNLLPLRAKILREEAVIEGERIERIVTRQRSDRIFRKTRGGSKKKRQVKQNHRMFNEKKREGKYVTRGFSQETLVKNKSHIKKSVT